MCKKIRGGVYMQTKIDSKMVDLRKRALQRRSSFPVNKDMYDTKVENQFFAEVKKELYKQIERN
jgi:hypothetical protein